MQNIIVIKSKKIFLLNVYIAYGMRYEKTHMKLNTEKLLSTYFYSLYYFIIENTLKWFITNSHTRKQE